MNELLEELTRQPELVEVSRSEFLSLLCRMENHYMDLYNDAMAGLRDVANLRRAIFQGEENGMIVKCKVGNDGQARVVTQHKPPMGFAK